MTEAVRLNPDLLRTIPTGISGVDACYVGARRGDFCMVTAETGGGKSIFLLQCAIHCVMNMGNVLLITIEMSEKEYIDRIYSYFSLLSITDIMNYRLSDEEILHIERRMKPFRECGNHLQIVHMPEGCTIDGIRNCVEEAKNEMNIDLIVVDYLNIIRNEKGQIDYSWENQCTLATELKLKIAKAYNIPLWTAQQTSGEGQGAYSKHIIDQLDCGVIIEKKNKKTFKTDGILKCDFNKHRSFSPVEFEVISYYKCSRFEKPTVDVIRDTQKIVRARRIKCQKSSK
jgi:replicative DNA helicase